MRILLDTHIVIWALDEVDRLPPAAREMLDGPRTDVFYSVASLWEIAIKAGLGKLEGVPSEIAMRLRLAGFQRLGVDEVHLDRVTVLPHHHRDPFDRLLVAQAETEPLKLITVDRQLAAYGSAVLLL